MSGTVAERKRLILLTAGNVRNKHLYVSDHLDFFPKDIVGPPRANGRLGERAVSIHLEGLNETIRTDIGSDARSGKPRRMFRKRGWVRRFIDHHDLREGDVLAMERLAKREYRLYPFQPQKSRDYDWNSLLDTPPPPGNGPTMIDLFAGCGGMALGFKRAGFRTVLANEWNAAACNSLRENITRHIAQCAIEEIDLFPKADIVIGGPPCQGFSNLGERVPNDPRRQMWRHFMRAIEESGASAFVMENVPPLLRSQEYIEILRIADRLGFNVVGKVLNAADYGVPQTRRRAFVIGMRVGDASHPEQSHVDPIKQDLHSGCLERWRTVRDSIGDIPSEPTEQNWHIGRNPTPLSKRRYRCIPPGGNRFDLPLNLTPECWKRKTKGGTDLFGRLWWDRPSVTIRCEFYKPEKGRYLHPEAHRPITHREAARLQGFDDDFNFQGKRIEVGVQIGNAVPPPLAEAVARHLVGLLEQTH